MSKEDVLRKRGTRKITLIIGKRRLAFMRHVKRKEGTGNLTRRRHIYIKKREEIVDS